MKRTKGEDLIIKQIDKCLPQIHCQKCGFFSCLPYAKAIVKKKANIYKCEPGGSKVVEKIGEITGERVIRANVKDAPPELVYIDPEACIGCTLCIQKCPVDAIAGAEGFLHTVIVDECNGCGFCVSSCPVDCISEKKRTKDNPWNNTKASISKTMFYEKRARTRERRLEADEKRLGALKELLFRDD
ncbi:RnfABCDGE type electron transport complex subunit B [Betaproteobacteria bacterium]|nr:RnfABCDGE type electron transport complex subunit B [Betaproteobacteria bacterium]